MERDAGIDTRCGLDKGLGMKTRAAAYKHLAQAAIGFLLLACFALAAASCHRQSAAQRQLALADELMEERPDSAYAILSQIDTLQLHGKADKAWYWTLLTQTDFKLKGCSENAAEMDFAAEALSEASNPLLQTKALFYKARILQDTGNCVDAMFPCLEAFEIASTMDNPLWMARASETLADLFSQAYLYEEAVKYAEIASREYKAAGKKLNHYYALRDYAGDLSNMHRYHESIQILDSISQIAAVNLKDTTLLHYTDLAKAHALMESGDYVRASRVMEDIVSRADAYFFSEQQIGELLQITLHNQPSAVPSILERYHVRMDSLAGDPQLDLAKAQYLESIGDYKGANEISSALLSLYTAEIEGILHQSALGAQRDYSENKAIAEAAKNVRLRYIIILMSITVIVIIIAIAMAWSYRNKARDAVLKSRLNQIAALSTKLDESSHQNNKLNAALSVQFENIELLNRQLEQKQSDIGSLNAKINEFEVSAKDKMSHAINALFKEKWQTLNMLFKEYVLANGMKNFEHQLAKGIKRELDSIKSKKKTREIVEAVNKYMDGILDDLKEDYPNLSKEETLLATYLIAGFSSTAICFLVDMQPTNYYTKKSRLLRKLQEQNPKKATRYIEAMS